MIPDQFIATWKNSDLNERQGAHIHFNGLCDLLGVSKPTGTSLMDQGYGFEINVDKTGGGAGYADAWKRNCFAWEYKSPGKDLSEALKQLRLYSSDLENPPLLIVSDMRSIELHTNWTSMVQEKHVLQLDDLADARLRQRLKWAFDEATVELLKPKRSANATTEEVARKFVALAQNLRNRGHDPEKVAHFVNQMVFCMFAEDVDLLPNREFERMLDQSLADPNYFQGRAESLFMAMAQKHGLHGNQRIDWFNGGLFEDSSALPLKADDIRIAVDAARQNWAEINPSIMGTLFERGLDPSKRSQLGAHYTDAEKIMMIVKLAIIDPLLKEWEQSCTQIAKLAETAKTHRSKGERTKALKAATTVKAEFIERLKNFRILDPACGSGNFLYLALKALKDIEYRVNFEAESLGLPPAFPAVGPECVTGIEINSFAAELARVAVWIGEIQWMREHNFSASKDPILKPLETIECRDALLNPDGTEAEWPQADVIIGNPPFVAARDMGPEIGEDYTAAVRKRFSPWMEGGVDFVCYWFIKAAKHLEEGQADRAGLVCTNSVPRSVSRKAIDFMAERGHIFAATSNMLWNTAPARGGTGKFAAVRISIICVGRSTPDRFMLDGRQVPGITTDLYERNPAQAFDQEAILALTENKGIAFQGIVPRSEVKKIDKEKHKLSDASFAVSGEEGRRLLLTPGNPNGNPNSDVVKRYLVAEDITDRDEERFIVDFSGLTEEQAAQYAAPFKFIEPVKLHRARMAQKDALATWWQFWRSRNSSRVKLASLSRYIATPRSAKHRVFTFVDARIVPDNAVVWFATDSVLHLGLLHSRIHEVWTRRRCSYQGVADTPRYKHTDVFVPFPFPHVNAGGSTPHECDCEVGQDAVRCRWRTILQRCRER
ncbi:MAG: DNA methyltransferase, partial [Pseudomonadota bacterium]